jgi:GxxExxY protein
LEPQINADERRLKEKTERIIGCVFAVSNNLGCGFLEKVYENALTHELRKIGLAVESQRPIRILYDGIVVGEYVADLLVDGEVLIETKAVKAFDEVHMAQCMNYLRATGLKLCLLVNFGTPKATVKRIANNL